MGTGLTIREREKTTGHGKDLLNKDGLIAQTHPTVAAEDAYSLIEGNTFANDTHVPVVRILSHGMHGGSVGRQKKKRNRVLACQVEIPPIFISFCS